LRGFMAGFLQFLGGNREGCGFDSSTSVLEVSTVCHEARSVEIAQGEKIFVSVRDVRRRDNEVLAPLGAACHMKNAERDTTLLLQLWAARDEASARLGGGGGRRACGELRIPLHRLILTCHGMLYQTWLTLDCPGLSDSVASIGLADDSAAFDQKLAEGPRQLFQPRVCLSVCQTPELGPSGRLLLTADASNETRNERWGPLLRSQQQHAVLSAALHLHGLQAGDSPVVAEDRAKAMQKMQEVRARMQAQAEEIETLRAKSSQGGGVLPWPDLVKEPQVMDLHADPLQKTVALEMETETIRSANQKQKAENERLRTDVERVREEANTKIDNANERIRALRRDRDEAQREFRTLQGEVQRLHTTQNDLLAETRQLAEQKDALLQIVEDLHQACAGAGLQTVGRQSIDSITANFQLT